MGGLSDLVDVLGDDHDKWLNVEKAKRVLGLAKRYTLVYGNHDYCRGTMKQEGFSRGSFLDALIVRFSVIELGIDRITRQQGSQEIELVKHMVRGHFSVDVGALYHPDGRIKLVKSPTEFRDVNRETRVSEGGALILKPKAGMTLDQAFDSYSGLIIEAKDIEEVSLTGGHMLRVVHIPREEFNSNMYLLYLTNEGNIKFGIDVSAIYCDRTKKDNCNVLSLILRDDLFNELREQERGTSLLMCAVGLGGAVKERFKAAKNGTESSYVSCIDCSDGIVTKFPAVLGVKYHGEELYRKLDKLQQLC